jgi:hypothetical protein
MFHLYVLLETSLKEDLRRQCRAMYADAQRDRKTPQRFWDWTICHLLGEEDLAQKAADDFLAAAKDLNKTTWLQVGGFMKGPVKEDELIAACRDRRFELAHAHYAVAIDHLANGRHGLARESFQNVLETNKYRHYVYQWSVVFLERLEDPAWLPWLPQEEHGRADDSSTALDEPAPTESIQWNGNT